MAFAIPKLQWKNVDTTGNTTNTDDDITNIPDTSDIEIGMFARGTGIPTGATVLSKTSTSVKLNVPNVATATASGVTLAFGFELIFGYPPVEPEGENLETKAAQNESLSGINQVSVNYVEGTRKLKFSFLTPTIKTSMDTFLTFALGGDAFRYYDDKTLTSYISYELNVLKVAPRKVAPKGVDTYTWEIPLVFRRVV